MTVRPTDLPERGIVLPELGSVDEMLAFADEAERAGSPSIWCAEAWGYNPFPLLGALAERTDCVLGTGIANGFARSPGTLAAQAMTLHQATEGRFVLGIGTSTPGIVEGFHGREFERPVRRVRETIEIVRRALSGERISYDGAVFDLDGFTLNGVPDGGCDVPVLNAAIGTTNLAMSLEYADGVTTYLLPIDAIPDALSNARERAGVDREVPVVAQVPTCVGDDPEVARAILGRTLAEYVGAVDFYRDVLARHGHRETVERVRTAWEAGDRERAAAEVSPALMDAVGVAGTVEEARDSIATLLDGPADGVVLTFPVGVDGRMRELALAALSEA